MKISKELVFNQMIGNNDLKKAESFFADLKINELAFCMMEQECEKS